MQTNTTSQAGERTQNSIKPKVAGLNRIIHTQSLYLVARGYNIRVINAHSRDGIIFVDSLNTGEEISIGAFGGALINGNGNPVTI